MKVGLTWDIYDLSWFLTESGIDMSWEVDSEMGLTAAMKYQSQLDLKAYGLFVVPS